jgi:dephospho-CoA kinase
MAQRLFGITGLYCAGKNYVARLLEQRNIPVLDIDKLGHEVLRREAPAIVRRFGKDVLDDGGAVDRKRLGALVFDNAAELAALEAIVHPAANRLTEEWLEQRNGLCAINAALLHKSSVYDKLEAIVVVEAPLLVRLFRAIKRDRLPLRELFRRFQSQNNFPRYKGVAGTVRQPTGQGAVSRLPDKAAQLFFCPADMYSIRNFGFFGSQQRLEKRIDAILEGLRHGKEKITVGRGFGGSISGDRGERRDSDF